MPATIPSAKLMPKIRRQNRNICMYSGLPVLQ
jgi:hypothetical protein